MSCKKLYLVTLLLKALDIASTIYLITIDGIQVESHPVAQQMIKSYGIVPGLLINGAVFLLAMTALYSHKAKGLLIVSSVLMFIIVLINTFTMYMYWVTS